MDWQIGCSGFHYKEWKSVFYPVNLPQRRWFEYYCTKFQTLELNVTFYKFPQLKSLLAWYEASPKDFIFSVKMPRLITHYKQFHDCGRMLTDVYTTIEQGLKDKLGPVLIQLPPRMKYSPETLDRIVCALNPSFMNVLEFRTADWWNRNTFSILKEKNISFCGISHPGLPDKVLITSPVVYYRFHGIPKRYFSAYKRSDLENVQATIAKSRKAKQAFVFFNNTASTAAIKNAIYFKKVIERSYLNKV